MSSIAFLQRPLSPVNGCLSAHCKCSGLTLVFLAELKSRSLTYLRSSQIFNQRLWAEKRGWSNTEESETQVASSGIESVKLHVSDSIHLTLTGQGHLLTKVCLEIIWMSFSLSSFPASAISMSSEVPASVSPIVKPAFPEQESGEIRWSQNRKVD